MNSIKDNIRNEVVQKINEYTNDIKKYNKQSNTINNIINGIANGEIDKSYYNNSGLYSINAYKKTSRLRRKIDNKISELYSKRSDLLVNANFRYKSELEKNKIISKRYKNRNKLLRRRPL